MTIKAHCARCDSEVYLSETDLTVGHEFECPECHDHYIKIEKGRLLEEEDNQNV